MALPAKRSPAAGEFRFEFAPEPWDECVTALGGIPLGTRAARSLDVPGSVPRHRHRKRRERGLDEATYVESFLVLKAAGGDCLEDFERLREDPGRAALLGHEVPGSEAARKFLYPFHDQEKLEPAQRELPVGQVRSIPAESAPRRALAQGNRDLVRELGRRCAGQKIATIDVDATRIESGKREAPVSYEGGSGYQPVLGLWAEMKGVMADEFRDGHGPSQYRLLPVTQPAFQALPETIQERYFRGHWAGGEEELLSTM